MKPVFKLTNPPPRGDEKPFYFLSIFDKQHDLSGRQVLIKICQIKVHTDRLRFDPDRNTYASKASLKLALRSLAEYFEHDRELVLLPWETRRKKSPTPEEAVVVEGLRKEAA